MSEPKCETCRFWLREDECDGWCRRYPPLALTEDATLRGAADAWSFPTVSTSDWCGEYQPKPNLE